MEKGPTMLREGGGRTQQSLEGCVRGIGLHREQQEAFEGFEAQVYWDLICNSL